MAIKREFPYGGRGPDVDFNSMFNRLANRLAKKKNPPAEDTMTLGNTEAGRTDLLGPQPETGERSGSFRIREYKQNPGATKGRGRLGAIRK